MTKVTINPGVCGLITTVEAHSDDQMEVKVTVKSGCEAVRKMMEELGDTFDAFACCLGKPGTSVFYDYAREHFPGHASCPTLAGILKCMEVECGLALPKEASITFEK
ncbi:MAG TPA: hypothetical protein IAC82_04100 [Candidatus Merdivicinus intestinigallinarum]|nr:hypothetical protein [Candidatus Merdivicinus intestinigallinarum]